MSGCSRVAGLQFFRWVSERFPLINVKIEGTVAPSIDMLYLDMNGIIHNCTHPSEDVTARIAEKDMVISIFNYIDKVRAGLLLGTCPPLTRVCMSCCVRVP